MDKMRSRKPTLRTQPSMAAKATREDFKPAVEWSEDSSTRTLLILLPSFTREEIRVQIDNAGKLLVKGSRQASDKKLIVVDQSFNVPEDTIVEKISGRFEDGRLTLILPRKVVKEQEYIQRATTEEKEKEGKKDEESIQKDAKKNDKNDKPIKEKDEPMQKERPTTTEEKQDGLTQKEKPKSTDDDKDQQTEKEKPRTEGEKKDGPVLEEKPEGGEEKKDDGPIRQQELERQEEKKYEPAEKKPESVEEKKEEDVISSVMERVKEKKNIEKIKWKTREICTDKAKETRKKILNWRGAEGSRLDSGTFDGVLEKLNRNRKVIAVAVVAFSVGFFVSHQLRTRGR